MENLPTYRLTQSGPEAQEILDQVNLNTADIEQLKRLYQALNQSEPEIIAPTDTWPVANPEENVIYRVIDRVNTPPQYYSDYMWNGTSMVPMAKYDNAIDNEPTANSNNLVKSGGVYSFVHANGGAYDISAAHAVGGVLATYDDLADALGTNGANVPAAVRKGGMSIKFVLSSDNKYVQYRYMLTDVSTAATFTNIANWQGVDDEPTAGSHNLVKSGGVKELFDSQYGVTTADFALADPNKMEIARFNGGHIKTKNFDSSQNATAEHRGLMSALDKAKLDTVEEGAEVNNIEYGKTKGDFALADPDGYEIARFARGHIKTKNFDSEFSIENYIAVENDELVDFSLKDGHGISLAQLKIGHIKTKHFYSKDALERIARLEYNQNPNTIYCVGDSITQGQPGIISPTDDEEQVNRYPDKLKVMVGDAFEVVNLGVGGQKPNEIFARMGWLDLLTDEDFTLPADTSLVAAPSFIGSNDAMGANYLMQQGTTETREQMSRCWMNGVECALSFSNNTLYINRVTTASKSTFFPSGTNVTFSGEKGLGIYLIYAFVNGHQHENPELLLGELKAATSLISGKFLVLGLFTAVSPQKESYDACNALLQKEFGSRYVDPQYICSQQAFDDLGYTPTEDSDITQDRYEHGVRSDAYQMERGVLPSSFWRYSWTPNYQSVDGVHLNSLGYTAMARMFYNKMKALKWV